MLSRVADGLFWISRYVERAENIARISDVYLQAEFDRGAGRQVDWEAILKASGADEDFQETGEEATAQTVTTFLLHGVKNPNSIFFCLERARENARMIRDQLTTEMWEELNRAWLELCGSAGRALRRQSQAGYYQGVRRASHLFRGTTMTTLSRGDAKDFLDLGMYLERADSTSRMLEAQSLQTDQVGQEERWEALLRSCSARECYRASHRGPLEAAGVLGYLIHDSYFPRSLQHGLLQTGRIAARLAQPEDRKEAEELVMKIREKLEKAPLSEGAGKVLARFLDRWQSQLQKLADWMTERIIGGKLELPEKSSWHSQQEQQQQRKEGGI